MSKNIAAEGLRSRSALLFTGLVLATVFLLAAVWEFLIEDHVTSFLGIDNPVESFRVKWEFVVTSTLFAAIAMFVTALALGRLSRRRERAEQERFQNTFAQAGVGIALMAADGHFLRVNPKLCEILGYSAQELGELNYEQVTCPEDLEGDRQILEDFLAGKLDTASNDKRYVRKNGEIIWAHRTTTLVRTSSGEPAHFTTTIEDITEHRRIQEELRQSEERYARAVSGTNDGVWDRDIETGKTYLSPRWAEMLGYTLDELEPVFETFTNLIHPDDKERMLAAADAHLKRDALYDVEFRLRRKDGEYCWVRARGRAVRDKDGNPVLMAGSTTDISERKRAEDELRKSEASLANAQRIGGFGNWDWNLVTGEVYRSAEIYRIFGTTPEQFPSSFEDYLDMVHGEDRDAVAKTFQRTFEDRIAHSFDCRIVRPDGETRTIHEEGDVRFNDAGEPEYISGTVRDITESRLADDLLRESEERYRSIIATTCEGFWRIDTDLRIVEANDAICRMLGYQREELLGRPSHGFVDESEADLIKARITEMMERKEVTVGWEIKLRKKDGTPLYTRTSATSITDKAGKPTGCFAFISDISAIKESEAKLRRAQKMEAVGQLTGGVAHDFNNLIAIILGNLEMARDGLAAADVTGKFLDTATRAGQRGAALVRRLLAFSRRQPLKNEVLDINTRVLAMVDLIGRSLGETVEVRTDLAADLWPAFADPGEFESLLLNLALNGRDAMPRGGGIEIVTGNTEIKDTGKGGGDELKPGRYVTLVVTDTGSGMSEEVLDQAFEPFFTTKEFGHGSGLGLSMAYGFVKQSGGKITIDSEIGVGTRVEVCLPCPATDSKPLETPVPETARMSARGEMILVVEDDADVRELAVKVLASLGYKTVEAAHGQAALEVLDRTPDVALVFTDIVLPGGMSGAELAGKIRTDRNDDVKILLTSGYPRDEILRHGNLDDLEMIYKPYRKPELARRLHDLLSQGGATEVGVPELRTRSSA